MNTPLGQIDENENSGKTTATTEPTPVMRQQDIPNGTSVPITVNGKQVMGIKVGYLADVDKCLVKHGPHTHRRKIHGFGAAKPRVSEPEPELGNGMTLADGAVHQGPVPERPAPLAIPQSRFDINTRFEFIAELADTVILGDANSLIVSGSGGLGKTYTILERLKMAGKISEDDIPPAIPEKLAKARVVPKKDVVEDESDLEAVGEMDPEDIKDAIAEHKAKDPRHYDYTVIKGFSTPKSMYRLLFNNKDKLVVFDDCDSILENPIAVNILKAALDSFETRMIHWLSEKGFGSGDEDDLPVRFEFTGKIIFVSNRTLSQIDQAILSRCLYVDVTMTTPEKIDRIRNLSAKMLPDMEQDAKHEVVDLLDTLKDQVGDLNVRTFLKVAGLRRRNPTRWKELAEYVITASMVR